MPPELLGEIYKNLSKEDLGNFSRTTKLSPITKNKMYIEKVKESLIKEIQEIIDHLNKIFLKSYPGIFKESVEKTTKNLQKMVDSNLEEGVSDSINKFSKVIDENFTDATRTKVLMILRDLNPQIAGVDKFLNKIMMGVPSYGYPNLD